MVSHRYLPDIIQALRSPHANMVYVAREYSKADLIRDLERILGTVLNTADEPLPEDHESSPTKTEELELPKG